MRRWISLSIALVVAVLAVDTLVWRWATDRAAADIAQWSAAQRAQGWTVSWGEPVREGWPWAARLRLSLPSITAPIGGAPLTLSADAAVLGIEWLSPTLLHARLEGLQSLGFSQPPELSFTTQRTEFTIPLGRPQTQPAADLAIDALQLDLLGTTLAVADARVHADVSPDGLAASVQADGIDLPASPLANALGSKIAHLGSDVVFTGPLADASTWHKAGGAVRLGALSLDWGRLGAKASGEMRLDDRLQPEGTLTTTLAGTSETLDALVAAHMLAPNAANVARTVLMLMQRPQPSGPALVEVPVVLKNQRLQVGQFPLLKLPDITW